MITEDYVSFETAKLLKEKGFDEECSCFYDNIVDYGTPGLEVDGRLYYENSALDDEEYAAPTLQMAMKWLREVHNIFICIIPSEVGAGVMDYTYVLYKIEAKNFYFKDLGIQGRAKNISEISYEKTIEAAIEYSLKHLI
jgi:hypothetical protein